jgi:hypothetical protein
MRAHSRVLVEGESTHSLTQNLLGRMLWSGASGIYHFEAGRERGA